MKKIFICSLIMLIGCAESIDNTPSPYKIYSHERGGYIDYHLNNSRYLITFRGNSFTLPETVKGYAYQRANELCHGNYIVEEEKDISTYIHQKNFHGKVFFGNVSANSEDVERLDKPRISITVKCNQVSK
jgi:hypothetical protein